MADLRKRVIDALQTARSAAPIMHYPTNGFLADAALAAVADHIKEHMKYLNTAGRYHPLTVIDQLDLPFEHEANP